MFEIKMTPEDVNRFVTDALLKSSLGEQLTAAINKELRDAVEGYNSPVKQIVSEFMRTRVKEIINAPENQERIKVAIAKVATDKFLTDLMDASVQSALKSMGDRY